MRRAAASAIGHAVGALRQFINPGHCTSAPPTPPLNQPRTIPPWRPRLIRHHQNPLVPQRGRTRTLALTRPLYATSSHSPRIHLNWPIAYGRSLRPLCSLIFLWR